MGTMFIPEDVFVDVAARFPYDICAAYCVVIVWDTLFSALYVAFMASLPSGGVTFCTFLWWWLCLPVVFSVPGISASFRAMKFYQQVRDCEPSKLTEYILNENCVQTVRLTWTLRKGFVVWNTVTLVLLMRPPINDVLNEDFLAAVWTLSVTCAFWTALKKVCFALWFNRLSRISRGVCPGTIELIAPAWTLRFQSGRGEEADDLMDTCMVCLSPFFTSEEGNGNETIRVRTLPCHCLKNKGRTYHVTCIDQWFRRRPMSAACPVCNLNIVPQPNPTMAFEIA